MYDLEVGGLEMLRRDIERAGEIPYDVQKEMVEVQAKITEEALVYTAADMLRNGGHDAKGNKVNYSTGDLAGSIKRERPKKRKSGPVSFIRFEGMQHGNRNAEVAFVNEYGKKKQPARPFIKTAMRQSNDPAANAARKVLDEYLRKKNL